MAKRGPKPKSSHVLTLAGSSRAAARADREVAAEPVVPEPPTWLRKLDLEVWHEIVGDLEPLRILTRVDREALGRYCRLVVRWRKLEQYLYQYGETVTLESGYVQQLPHVAISSKLAQLIGKLEGEFGLTPAARSRIEVTVGNAEPEENKKARYFA